ncbi:hypothetical protein BDW74DRAFT_183284 [Aspergillus multicolor]|uniref:uncharacterized protein n=1 Tax=Aspergillus multicolor TaxID=41759 RepID=UPI003CCD27C3
MAGNFAAWGHGHHLYWQNLAFRDDGTSSPIQRLDVKNELQKEDADEAKPQLDVMPLNADGFLLGYPDTPSNHRNKMDPRRNCPDTGPVPHKPARPAHSPPRRAPRLLRDQHQIIAVAIDTNTEVYRALVPGTGLNRAWSFHYTQFLTSGGPYTGLLRLNRREVLVSFISSPTAPPGVRLFGPSSDCEILVVDGATGRFVQQIPLTKDPCSAKIVWKHASGIILVSTVPDVGRS